MCYFLDFRGMIAAISLLCRGAMLIIDGWKKTNKTNGACDFTVSRRLDLMMLVTLKSLNPTTTLMPTVYNGYTRTHDMTHTTRFAIPRALWRRPVVCIETAGTTSCRDTSVLVYCVIVNIIIFSLQWTRNGLCSCVYTNAICTNATVTIRFGDQMC